MSYESERSDLRHRVECDHVRIEERDNHRVLKERCDRSAALLQSVSEKLVERAV